MSTTGTKPLGDSRPVDVEEALAIIDRMDADSVRHLVRNVNAAVEQATRRGINIQVLVRTGQYEIGMGSFVEYPVLSLKISRTVGL